MHRSNALVCHRANTFLVVGATGPVRFWSWVPQGQNRAWRLPRLAEASAPPPLSHQTAALNLPGLRLVLKRKEPRDASEPTRRARPPGTGQLGGSLFRQHRDEADAGKVNAVAGAVLDGRDVVVAAGSGGIAATDGGGLQVVDVAAGHVLPGPAA